MRKVGIVGAGAVGAACAMALALRHSTDEIVLVNRTPAKSVGIATDITYGAAMGDVTAVRSADISDLAGCSVVLLTAGVNEKTGGATDRNDKEGRLKLLTANAKIYRELVPVIVAAAPSAVIIVVTDPPDPLTDVARASAGHERVFGTGTFLDSLRFRTHLGRHFGVAPGAIDALVIGEHGTSSVFLWSSARIAGSSVEALVERPPETRERIERDVRQANIAIISSSSEKPLERLDLRSEISNFLFTIFQYPKKVLPTAFRPLVNSELQVSCYQSLYLSPPNDSPFAAERTSKTLTSSQVSVSGG